MHTHVGSGVQSERVDRGEMGSSWVRDMSTMLVVWRGRGKREMQGKGGGVMAGMATSPIFPILWNSGINTPMCDPRQD
jgi:hypothetical protein